MKHFRRVIRVLLTVEEVAAYLRVPPRTVRGLVSADLLCGIRISNGHLRIEQTELERFLRSRRTRQDRS